jgi:hypothetical protein
MVFDPQQDAVGQAPQRRDIFSQQHHAKRQHPQAENRQNAEKTSRDEQEPRRHTNPAGGWLAKPANGRLQTDRQSADQTLKAPLSVGPSGAIRVVGVLAVHAQWLLAEVTVSALNPDWLNCGELPSGPQIDRFSSAKARSTAIRHREV